MSHDGQRSGGGRSSEDKLPAGTWLDRPDEAEEKEEEGVLDTARAGTTLERCPVTVPGQDFAVIGLIACLPDAALLAKMEAEGKTFDTQFIIKIYGTFATREAGEQHAKRVHAVDPNLSIFIVMTNEALPIPMGEVESADAQRDKEKSPLAEYVAQAEAAEEEAESEMSRKCDKAAKKSRQERREFKRKQEKHLKKRGPSIPITQETVSAAAAPNSRQGMHVTIDDSVPGQRCWRLVNLDVGLVSAVDPILRHPLGSKLISKRPNDNGGQDVCACNEPGKALADWASAVSGVPRDSVKVYIKGPTPPAAKPTIKGDDK